MASSLGYKRDSSAKVSSTPLNSAAGETRRGGGTVDVDDTIFNPSETLDQQLLYHHQLNPEHNNRSGSPDINPDPVEASIAPIRATGTQAAANRSNQRSSAPRQVPPPSTPPTITSPLVRYRECLKNHAATLGAHIVDGCGEFMSSGEEGTPEALKCAACDCHRNFHRKEIDGESQYAATCHYPYSNHNNQRNTVPHHHQLHPQQPPPSLHHRISYTSPQTAPVPPIMMSFGGGGSSGGLVESSSQDLDMFQSTARGQTSLQPRLSKKRFRTKFTQQQKDGMLEIAEKLGWRIQKHDEPEVMQFCNRIGVTRQVFKVWMHNNKQPCKKKQVEE